MDVISGARQTIEENLPILVVELLNPPPQMVLAAIDQIEADSAMRRRSSRSPRIPPAPPSHNSATRSRPRCTVHAEMTDQPEVSRWADFAGCRASQLRRPPTQTETLKSGATFFHTALESNPRRDNASGLLAVPNTAMPAPWRAHSHSCGFDPSSTRPVTPQQADIRRAIDVTRLYFLDFHLHSWDNSTFDL